MIHLLSTTIRPWQKQPDDPFPFNLALLRNTASIEFTSPVTFFVGENGCGKSTLLEAFACAIGSTTIGSQSVSTDPTLSAVRKFSRQLSLSWRKRTQKGYFLRAEDFFGYAKRLAKMRQELLEDYAAVEKDYQDRSDYAANLARSPYARELNDLEKRYGNGLDNASHGEIFLSLFQSRFVPGGLYLLDEPEAPLSPLRQLAFVAALQQMTAQDGQFIIATHSPIILALPGAQILSFEDDRLQPKEYQHLEHVQLTRDFLNNPQSYLNRL